MSDYRKLEHLKQQYDNIEIPKELNERVEQLLQERPKKSRLKKWGLGTAAAVFAVFAVSVNVSPAFAQSVSGVPVLGNIARIVSVQMFDETNDDRQYNAQVEIPVVSGLKDQELQESINQDYAAEGKRQYDAFQKELGSVPADQLVNKSLSMGYEVVVNDGKLLVIKSYSETTQASTDVKVQYKTIDVANNQVLTLPSLFQDDSYITAISQYIQEQIALDPDSYFTAEGEAFQSITADQTFYINKEGKLVISFDKYEIAPGYKGIVEFVIPTDCIQDSLVSNAYIK